jgi:hypothetical protein
MELSFDDLVRYKRYLYNGGLTMTLTTDDVKKLIGTFETSGLQGFLEFTNESIMGRLSQGSILTYTPSEQFPWCFEDPAKGREGRGKNPLQAAINCYVGIEKQL